MVVTVKQVVDIGNDVLEIIGEDTETGEALVAQGWVSAMTNYHQPNHYDEHGNLRPGTEPREMTEAEKLSYWSSLLGEPFVPEVLYSVPEPLADVEQDEQPAEGE